VKQSVSLMLYAPKCGQQVKVKVTLRLTVSQSVCLGVEPHLGHMIRNLLIDLIGESYSLVYGGALPDERSGLSLGNGKERVYIYILQRRRAARWVDNEF
jgi:hypothetical protein